VELDELVEYEEDPEEIRAHRPFASAEDRRKFLEETANEVPLRLRRGE
jgi:hypothetical protein